MTGKFYAKDLAVTEVELKVHRASGLFYRPGTSDANMLKECTSDYPTVDCSGKVVFDCGGNIGGFTCRAIRQGAAEVVVFEPEPFNFEVLETNVHLVLKEKASGIAVTMVNAAVVAGDDTVLPFYINSGSNAMCSASLLAGRHRLQVNVDCVNFFTMLENFRPSLIKMDIEGGEYPLIAHGLPEYVKELAIELHGSSKATNGLMHSFFEEYSESWNLVSHEFVNIFNAHSITLAHFSRLP
jgi:FkbM family methyltransferase